jgi:preprotein translocase subunit SecE
MAGFIQYLKDTRGELRHVAWPTQMQTIVYTALVVAISIGVALYLGLFDYIFTGALARYLEIGGGSPIQPVQIEQINGETVPAGDASSAEFTVTPSEQE